MTQPRIGIPSRFTDIESKRERTLSVREPYILAVLSAGGLPIMIPHTASTEFHILYLKQLDGLLLAGGEDVDPARYGQTAHEKLGPVCADRDRCEIELTRRAFEADMPILAICRGVQTLNVALGGTLVQDIPSQRTSTIIHSTGTPAPAMHPITCTADSRLAAILGRSTIEVNSLHHQALDRCAPLLQVCATAADGIIEGVEAPSKRFVIGVQSHPELIVTRDGASPWSQVFRAFVAACEEFAERGAA